MPRLLPIRSADELQQFDPSPQAPPLEARAFAGCPPEAHWIVADGTLLLGRLSLWWTNTPALDGHRAGLIGHYAARDAATSHQLLAHACAELTARGCTMAIGPMDGNTLRRYRFLVERGDEPPFLLEPDNPDEWPGFWLADGFAPLATYYSSLNTRLAHEEPRIPHAEARLAGAGVTIRPMRADTFEADLRRIYRVSAVSFRQNFLYTPFTEEEYLDLYRPFRPAVIPEMVLIAEQGDAPVGFLFAIPDLLQAQRGATVDTVILKTVAVLPGRAYAGLGNVLVAHGHRIARERGYRRAIHALMHEENSSLNLSNRYSRPFRRYVLYAKGLRP